MSALNPSASAVWRVRNSGLVQQQSTFGKDSDELSRTSLAVVVERFVLGEGRRAHGIG